jgi:hypothetical protein
VRFRKWQNGRAVSSDIESVEAQLRPGRIDLLGEGELVIVCQGHLQESGPPAGFCRRQITAVPKERPKRPGSPPKKTYTGGAIMSCPADERMP